MLKRIAAGVGLVASILAVIEACVPEIQGYLGKPLLVPRGVILLAGIGLWLEWVRTQELKTRCRREPVPTAKTMWKTEYEPFPEQDIACVLRRPTNAQGDFVDQVLPNDPRCLTHRTPLTQRSRYSGWWCAACRREKITRADYEQLQTLAKSRLIHRLCGSEMASSKTY